MSNSLGILKGVALTTSLFLAATYVGYRAGVIHFGKQEAPTSVPYENTARTGDYSGIDRSTFSGSKAGGVSAEPPKGRLSVMPGPKSEPVGRNTFEVGTLQTVQEQKPSVDPSVRERAIIYGSKSGPVDTSKPMPYIQDLKPIAPREPTSRDVLPGSKAPFPGVVPAPNPPAPVQPKQSERTVLSGSKSMVISRPQIPPPPPTQPAQTDTYEKQLQSAVRAYSDKEMKELISKALEEQRARQTQQRATQQQQQSVQQEQKKTRTVLPGSKSDRTWVPAE